MRLATLVARRTTQFGHTNDFGDDWQHRVDIEPVAMANPALEYPRFLTGAWRAPPEDIGGVWGYEEFVTAITRPRRREHAAMLAWHGGPYDPADVGEHVIVAALSKISKRRMPGRAAYLKSVGRQN